MRRVADFCTRSDQISIKTSVSLVISSTHKCRLLVRRLIIVYLLIFSADHSVKASFFTYMKGVLFMKIVYPRVCGVDVHKSFIVAVICISESIEPRYLKKRFSTFHNSLVQFRNWLIDNDCHDVCMESTGKYYVPVYNVLEGHISNIVVANPKWVRAVKGEKDDDKDAKWIADLFKFGIVNGSFIPSKDIRILRELTRYKFKLTSVRSSEKNRYQNALTVGNCKLDMVFSDVFGKSASNIANLILSDNPYTEEDIFSKVHGSCKASEEDIINAVSGIDLTPIQKARIHLIQRHMDQVSELIDEVNGLIDVMAQPFEKDIAFLCQIPGIKRDSAIIILSEIGDNMEQFSSSRRISSWAGLTPMNNQSAGKKKSVKISRAGVYLKPCLVEVAHAAVKDKKHPYYANKFNKISKRRGKKRAYIAIARKILIAIYHMLLTGEVWNPRDLSDIETPIEQREKYLKNNLKSDVRQLLSIGLTIEDLNELIQQNAKIIPTPQ